MRLSVCMIVKNEEENLKKTLPSLSNYADEIIVVDTGSSDKTVEVAEKFGAEIYYFTWRDDFSAARNASLGYASGGWILWLDADESIKEEDLKSLRSCLEDQSQEAYSLPIYESRCGEFEEGLSYARPKVFRNGLGFKFVRPINEQLVDRDGSLVKAKAIPVPIYHWGKHLDAAKMKEKRERYVRLYGRALAENPGDPYLHLLLANNLKELQRLEEALLYYDQSWRLAPKEEIGRKALEKKADLLLIMKRLPEAVKAAEELLRIDSQNIPARNILATFCLVSGKIENAIAILNEALDIKVGSFGENVFQTKAMPYFLLSKAFMLKGEKDKAENCALKARNFSGGRV